MMDEDLILELPDLDKFKDEGLKVWSVNYSELGDSTNDQNLGLFRTTEGILNT